MNIIHFLFFIVLVGPTAPSALAQWHRADRSSVGIAPKPSEEPRAMVQIYSARVYGWKGYFAVHSWIATKEENASDYTVYEVMGFRVQKGIPAVRIRQGQPDRRWFGSEPTLHFDERGKSAQKMIPHIERAVETYPYPEFYRVWPGPNSNTFVSHIIRNTPGIYMELPPTAIGKDWIGEAQPIGFTESGTGTQFSLFGLFGVTLGLAEGLEVNILGMSFGVDVMRPALKLPFVGRVGFDDQPVFKEVESVPEEKTETLTETLSSAQPS